MALGRGPQLHTGKRDNINTHIPPPLDRLGTNPPLWRANSMGWRARLDGILEPRPFVRNQSEPNSHGCVIRLTGSEYAQICGFPAKACPEYANHLLSRFIWLNGLLQCPTRPRIIKQ